MTAFLFFTMFLAIAIKVAWPIPQPNFTVSFGVDDSPLVALTNESLFQLKLINKGTNADKTSLVFKSFSRGCIIIPVDVSKSNVVFGFNIQNDSSVTVRDLSMAVGFPDDWKIEMDSERWKDAREHLLIPGWELSYTNLQSWAADNPSPMFPSDSIEFSITDFTAPIYGSPTSKNGFISFMVRSTGFEEMISANLMFFPRSHSFVKPIVTRTVEGTDGLWRISVTPKELEDSQK